MYLLVPVDRIKTIRDLEDSKREGTVGLRIAARKETKPKRRNKRHIVVLR